MRQPNQPPLQTLASMLHPGDCILHTVYLDHYEVIVCKPETILVRKTEGIPRTSNFSHYYINTKFVRCPNHGL